MNDLPRADAERSLIKSYEPSPPSIWIDAATRCRVRHPQLSIHRVLGEEPEARRFPDFYLIGPQKTATTWLYVQLQMHPQVWSPIVKEIMYFDHLSQGVDGDWMAAHRRAAFLNSLDKSNISITAMNGLWPVKHIEDMRHTLLGENQQLNDEWYASFFPIQSDERICYDASPTYATLSEQSVAHMHSLNPEAKIILVLRDPVLRVWSYIRMQMQLNNNYSLEFQRAICESDGHFLKSSSDYVAIKNKYKKSFGDRLLTIDYRLVSSRPLAVLAAVTKFLNIDFDGDLFYKCHVPVFEGPSTLMPDSSRKLVQDLVADLRPGMESEFGQIARGWAW